ncbi:C40 family peptidase [Parasphingopyxis sp. CP4]|uniref:C40 family peptidase n=1 Tax=Parasphingopyxis sp. CP4 TaxID=2724527 RepID=UPI0015A35C5E|nr:NlpC/P60 family protein [Parasphingopyxis sp. CP4]QLC21200.1 C40 family peptidase [Parasphingopyxis sp. CP4]
MSVADLRCDPGDEAELGSQLLFGERFAWLDTVEDWAWGYCVHDHFVGFVRKGALTAVTEPTHIVSTVSAPVANGSAEMLHMGSAVTGDVAGDTLHLADGAVALSDVHPLGSIVEDPVAIAEMFIGAPYLLGGRSIAGIDCSGLVQIALAMAGHAVQRDSDMQQNSIGEPLSADAGLERGDLIFFPDHVGMMVNSTDIIHATGHAGSVVTEPLVEVTGRIATEHDAPVLARRRIAR